MEMIWALFLAPLLIYLFTKWSKSRNLPPGPWNLPIVGYLPWINPKFPYLTLTELSEKYGSIFGLYLGGVYTVVVTDPKLVKKLLNKDAASGRAPLYLTHGMMQGYGIVCAEGPLWKDQRKFIHTTLRNLGGAKTGANRNKMQELILSHIAHLIKHLQTLNNEPLDPLEPLRHFLGSTICSTVFGKSWPQDDETWKWLQHLQEEGVQHIGVAGPINFLPFLRFLPKFQKTIAFLMDGKVKTHKVYAEIIKERSNATQNFIHAFLEEKSKRPDHEKEAFYNDTQFHHILADLFGAGLDTTLTTLRWYLLYVAIYQEVQEKIRQQLEILGDKLPTMDDVAALPYVEASIAEVQRIRSVTPVGIPHGSLEDLEVDECGYKIPKGTMIMPLQWAIHMDPRNWEHPECYKPERFINEEGKFFRPEAFMPFQVGKRMCVGEELARMYLFLFGVSLIQRFHIVCEDVSNVDLTGECGIVLTPKPYKLRFKEL